MLYLAFLFVMKILRGACRAGFRVGEKSEERKGI